MNKFKFPCDINNIDKPKVIAIHLNNPFIEREIKHTEDELIQILDFSLNSIKNIVYVNPGENFMTYYKRRTPKIVDLYKEVLKS